MITNGIVDCNNIFNGDAWISLAQKSACDLYMLERFRDSYSEWIIDHLCVVVDPNIEGVSYTNYIDADEFYSSLRKRLVFDSNPDRYSYYIDEVQTNVPVPINKFLALGYPMDYFRAKKGDQEVEKDIELLYDKLHNKKLDIPIVNSSVYDFADDFQHIECHKIKKIK